ncbi:outer membrane protein assembly factor BamB family protein [Pyrococcus kukulkanii]|uniref:outer membrane protein assembly factor BamB family protein n=1 Tax=Pyrococcus kukulkanii TaxID=1609559 RepID=UPI00356132E1
MRVEYVIGIILVLLFIMPQTYAGQQYYISKIVSPSEIVGNIKDASASGDTIALLIEVLTVNNRSTDLILIVEDGKIVWRMSTENVKRISLIGETLVVGYRNGTVQAIDITSGRGMWQATLCSLRNLSSNGELIVVACEDKIVVLNLKDGSVIWEANMTRIGGLAWGNKNGYLAVSHNGLLTVFDASGKIIRETDPGIVLTEIKWSEDDNFIAGISERFIFIWNLTGERGIVKNLGFVRGFDWRNGKLWVLNYWGYLMELSPAGAVMSKKRIAYKGGDLLALGDCILAIGREYIYCIKGSSTVWKAYSVPSPTRSIELKEGKVGIIGEGVAVIDVGRGKTEWSLGTSKLKYLAGWNGEVAVSFFSFFPTREERTYIVNITTGTITYEGSGSKVALLSKGVLLYLNGSKLTVENLEGSTIARILTPVYGGKLVPSPNGDYSLVIKESDGKVYLCHIKDNRTINIGRFSGGAIGEWLNSTAFVVASPSYGNLYFYEIPGKLIAESKVEPRRGIQEIVSNYKGLLAVVSGNVVYVFNGTNEVKQLSFNSSVGHVQWLNGTLIVSTGNHLLAVDVDGGYTSLILEVDPTPRIFYISSDMKAVAIGTEHSLVLLSQTPPKVEVEQVKTETETEVEARQETFSVPSPLKTTHRESTSGSFPVEFLIIGVGLVTVAVIFGIIKRR